MQLAGCDYSICFYNIVMVLMILVTLTYFVASVLRKVHLYHRIRITDVLVLIDQYYCIRN